MYAQASSFVLNLVVEKMRHLAFLFEFSDSIMKLFMSAFLWMVSDLSCVRGNIAGVSLEWKRIVVVCLEFKGFMRTLIV